MIDAKQPWPPDQAGGKLRKQRVECILFGSGA